MFWAMAAMAGLACIFVVTNAVEPRSYYRKVADGKGGAEASGKLGTVDGDVERLGTGARVLERGRHIFRGVVLVFRTPSFLLILLGNIIGTVVAGNQGYKIMYLQVRPPPFHPNRKRPPVTHACAQQHAPRTVQLTQRVRELAMLLLWHQHA